MGARSTASAYIADAASGGPLEEPPVGLASVGRHAIIYGLGNVLSKAVAFLMLPIYTRCLTPADYGVMALVDMTLDVISILAGGQIALGVFRFYHKAESAQEKRDVVSTAFIALAVSYLVAGLVTFAAAGPLSHLVFGSDTHRLVVRVAAANFALQSLLLVPLAYARVRDRSMVVFGANLVKLVAGVVLNLVFVVALRLGVVGVFLSGLVASGLVGGCLTIWVVRQVGVHFSRPALGNLVRYGVPLLGMKAATFVATFADRYFLQAVGNESMVGLYNLAYQFGFVMMFLGFSPIELVWGPKRLQVAMSPDPSPVLSRGFRLVNVILITAAVGIILFVGDVLRVMATPPFYAAATVVPIIVAAYVLQGWASLQDIGILVSERTKILMVVNVIAALVALAGYALLIPRYYGMGAAVATLGAFAVRYVLTYLWSQRVWRVSYEWDRVVRLVVAAGGVCAVGLGAPPVRLVASVAFHVFLLAAYCLIVWLCGVLTLTEKASLVAFSTRIVLGLPARVRALGSVDQAGRS